LATLIFWGPGGGSPMTGLSSIDGHRVNSSMLYEVVLEVVLEAVRSFSMG
jgi:hypothetical protein